MATQVLDPATVDLSSSRRTLVLVWQNPQTRRFVKVGQLHALPESHFAFQYLDTAWDDPDFVPLLEYPDPSAAYVSDEVPAFFANRVLSAERPSYGRYLNWLNISTLDIDDIPCEVLARTGGGRATDTFHVVDLPLDRSDAFRCRFFVSGVRHVQESGSTVSGLEAGTPLTLELETSNPSNPKAVLIDTTDGCPIGYVPDWLCDDIYDRVTRGWQVDVVTERVNRDAPAHTRVLCRIDARPLA